MPTNRTRRRRQPNTVTLASLSIRAKLTLLVGESHPPRNDVDRLRQDFASYTHMVDTYRAVRPAFLERFDTADFCFAEELFQAVQAHPGADVEQLGAQLDRRRYGGG